MEKMDFLIFFQQLSAENVFQLIQTAVAVVLAAIAWAFSQAWKAAQHQRLEIESRHNRERHNLRLFETLTQGDDSLRLAAAAVLIERIKLNGKEDNFWNSERRTIIRALISLTKDRETGAVANAGTIPHELLKFVVDSVIREVGAIIPEKGEPVSDSSALKGFDVQFVRFDGCWIPHFDGRGLDLYRGSFRGCGMRNSDFRKAQLKNAVFTPSPELGAKTNLSGSRFGGANCENADFSYAFLKGCDFRGAKLDGAKFDGAELDGAVFDVGCHPQLCDSNTDE